MSCGLFEERARHFLFQDIVVQDGSAMDDMVLSGAEVGISKVVSVERDQDGIKKVELESLLRRCCTARSKLLTSLCRWQSHPAQYVSGIPSAVILLSISHPIRCSTRCLANVRVRISGPMIAL